MTLSNYSIRINPSFSVGPVNLMGVNRGTVLLVGPNGSGKTSLLRSFIESRLFSITGSIDEDSKQFTFIEFHRYNSYFTVHYFLSLCLPPSSNSGDPQGSLRILSPTTADLVHNLWNKRLVELSSGQTQKVLIARAWLEQRPIVLFDEPTNFLDLESRQDFISSVRELQKSKLVWIATHEQALFEILVPTKIELKL